jgi:DNA-binding NtrC family response regulator
MENMKVLVLDDEAGIREEIDEFFSSRNLEIKHAASPSEAFRVLSGTPVDIAILDIRLPEMSGLEVLRRLKRQYPATEVIMMSGHGDMDSVIEALRSGAIDYFKKPFRLSDMLVAIEKTAKYISVSRLLQTDNMDQVLPGVFSDDGSSALFAVSPAMKLVVTQMQQVARASDTTVLITGESGTGKELIARGIHQLSDRNKGPFFAVNCSSVPDELFESEFFGYKKGAFTGAFADKPGWFEAAEGGVLFLDEIGDLKPALQAKLLRVLDERRVTRLGTTQSRPVNVRLVAATNQDLEKLQAEGRFRGDLYHRLNAFVIYVPPLRERKKAIPVLAAHFLKYYAEKLGRKIARIDREVLDMLDQYDFPGNVRELRHMIERAVIICNCQPSARRPFRTPEDEDKQGRRLREPVPTHQPHPRRNRKGNDPQRPRAGRP